jgi:hypothetical protein
MTLFQQLSDEILDAVNRGLDFPHSVADQLVALADRELTDEEKGQLLLKLAPAWRASERESRKLTEEKRGGSPAAEAKIAEVADHVKAANAAEANDRDLAMEVASFLGADIEKTDQVVAAMGTELSDLRQEYPDVPEELDAAIFRDWSRSADSCEPLGQLIDRILKLAGPNVHWSREVVLVLAARLEELFPQEEEDREDHFCVCQSVYLLEDFLRDHPEDPAALAWLGELEAKRGHVDRALEIAHRIWRGAVGFTPRDYLLLLDFLFTVGDVPECYVSLAFDL